MQDKFFSIIVVALNPGEKLNSTLNSIVKQSFQHYEVIVKDGGSTDGSIEQLEKDGFFAVHSRFLLVREKDDSIYEGMNQAVELAEGEYILFLNCGDLLYDEKVLEQVAAFIGDRQEPGAIYYGNQYNLQQKSVVYSAPQINDFTCYRNVPCHQVCFYSRDLFKERAYNPAYQVRADYEHFLYCVYEKRAKTFSMPVLVASYEGGGFSETAENRRWSAGEHREITGKYLGRAKVRRYRLVMWLTLAPVRTRMAESPVLSGIYNGIKGAVYGLLHKK